MDIEQPPVEVGGCRVHDAWMSVGVAHRLADFGILRVQGPFVGGGAVDHEGHDGAFGSVGRIGGPSVHIARHGHGEREGILAILHDLLLRDRVAEEVGGRTPQHALVHEVVDGTHPSVEIGRRAVLRGVVVDLRVYEAILHQGDHQPHGAQRRHVELHLHRAGDAAAAHAAGDGETHGRPLLQGRVEFGVALRPFAPAVHDGRWIAGDVELRVVGGIVLEVEWVGASAVDAHDDAARVGGHVVLELPGHPRAVSAPGAGHVLHQRLLWEGGGGARDDGQRLLVRDGAALLGCDLERAEGVGHEVVGDALRIVQEDAAESRHVGAVAVLHDDVHIVVSVQFHRLRGEGELEGGGGWIASAAEVRSFLLAG